jgi:hypothetical protein
MNDFFLFLNIFTLTYVLPAFYCYLYDDELYESMVCFIPLMNIILAITALIDNYVND